MLIFQNFRPHSRRNFPLNKLFQQITELHPALLDKMQKLEDKRTYWEGLSDKVNAINDARTALDALRHEHKEEMKRRKEEAERQRQILV